MPLPPLPRLLPVHRLIVLEMHALPELLAGIGKIVIGGFEGKPAFLHDARVVQVNVELGRAFVQTHHEIIDQPPPPL